MTGLMEALIQIGNRYAEIDMKYCYFCKSTFKILKVKSIYSDH
jgi:hypothetical protein